MDKIVVGTPDSEHSSFHQADSKSFESGFDTLELLNYHIPTSVFLQGFKYIVDKK